MSEHPCERGERPCRKCGKPHNCYYVSKRPSAGISWADPDDGHTYEPLSWEEMYRKAVAA